MSFVGAKGGAGVYQRIICWIPPHDLYIEPFAGTAAVFRNKRVARRSVLIDCDPGALDQIGEAVAQPGVEVIVGDGVEYLRRFRPSSSTAVVVYADPPYLRHTRRDPVRKLYAREWTVKDHEYFLDVVVGVSSFPILISGYWSQLYADRLAGWHTDHFDASTRGGPAVEWLWANYPRPSRLHDYRYIGADFGERWRIHKRQRSWCRILGRMPALERRAMLANIADTYRDELSLYLDGDVAGYIAEPSGEDPAAGIGTGGGGRPATKGLVLAAANVNGNGDLATEQETGNS